MTEQEQKTFTAMREALEQALRGMSAAIFGTDTYKVSSRGDFASKVEKQIQEALTAANAVNVEPVGINGLTESETSASMSVMGLSKPQAQGAVPWKCVNGDACKRGWQCSESYCQEHCVFRSQGTHPQATEPAPSTAGEREEKVVSLPVPLSAFHLKLEIAELIQSHKYKGLRSIEVLGVFQFLSADIISGSST